MLGCHYATPKREQIAKMLGEGKNEEQIVNAAVKQEGLQALVTPPAEGFNVLAWLMPFIMIGLGLVVIGFFIKRMSAKRAAAGTPELDDAVLDRYHDQIEKETSRLE